MKSCKVAILVAVNLWSSLCVGAAEKRLSPDDPELYAAFFAFVSSLHAWSEKEAVKGPSRRAVLNQSIARHLRIKETELAAVATIGNNGRAELERIRSEEEAYLNALRGGVAPPIAPGLANFVVRRRDAILQAKENLRIRLNADSWRGINDYVTREYRLHISPAPNSPKGR